MRLRIYIIIAYVFAFSILLGSNFVSKGDLTMYLDSYQYSRTNNNTLVELSYSIDLSYLNYINSDDQYDNMQITIIVESINGSSILNKSVTFDDGAIENSEMTYIGLQSFNTSYDTVKISLFFKDSFVDKQCQIQELLPIQKYDSSPSISDIMFVKNIDKNKSNSIFS